MDFATELKALFEKYDVKFDVKNEYTVEFVSGNDYSKVVYVAADPECEVWEKAAERMVVYSR